MPILQANRARELTRRRVLGLLAGAAATAGLSAFWISRMTNYTGPVFRSFRRQDLLRSDGVPPKTLGEVLRWQFGGDRQPAGLARWVPSAHADTPPARVAGNRVRLSFVGHASWLIQTAASTSWSTRCGRSGLAVWFAGPKRHNDPGIAFDALPQIDVVLVSHGHYDHLDLATLSSSPRNSRRA